jgi:predicted outer membrane repeat protein
MKKIKNIAIKSVVVVGLFVILLSFRFVQKSSAATFSNFKTAIGVNNYDIDLIGLGFNNPLVWTNSLSNSDFASSGTIRGANGVDVSTLSGGSSHNRGFVLQGTASAYKQLHFIGNIGFYLFGDATIRVSYTSISFNNSMVSFTKNITGSGVVGAGAIYAKSGTNISFNNSSASFIENRGSGGSIYIESGTNISFKNSSISFIRNSGNDSGAIRAENSSISFNNSVAHFIENSSSLLSSLINGGAAISASYSSISFNNSSMNFRGNTTSGLKGGAIFAYQKSTISFNNSIVSFSENSAINKNGQVIYVFDTTNRINFNN